MDQVECGNVCKSKSVCVSAGGGEKVSVEMRSAMRECVSEWDGWGQVQRHMCITEGMSVNKESVWLDHVCDGHRWEGEWCCE